MEVLVLAFDGEGRVPIEGHHVNVVKCFFSLWNFLELSELEVAGSLCSIVTLPGRWRLLH